MRALFVIFASFLLVVAEAPLAHARVEPGSRSARSAVADTLHARVAAGESLILALPASYQGREAEYRLLEGPALSWLVDRSFFWRTLPTERGVMHVRVERRTAGAAVETLILAIDVTGS